MVVIVLATVIAFAAVAIPIWRGTPRARDQKVHFLRRARLVVRIWIGCAVNKFSVYSVLPIVNGGIQVCVCRFVSDLYAACRTTAILAVISGHGSSLVWIPIWYAALDG